MDKHIAALYKIASNLIDDNYITEALEVNNVIKQIVAKKKSKKMKSEDPCWEGYEMVGKKTKNGKEVPNCVPKEK
jgi:hypothetical protein